MKPDAKDLLLAAHTIRGLAMDAVQSAKSGHPGMPMGMADVAVVLWLKHLQHCPSDPDWQDRDRFVLSAGHGSMLLYSLLHLSGYNLPLAQLRAFRQPQSMTPGHPEAGRTPGVETTTGPLGQGCANAVGMALTERMLAERFNSGDYRPIDHRTYVIASDGDLMEGVSHEAFSFAGHLGLHRLIVLYDSNRITIEGPTALAYSDDVKRRFQGYHWNVLETDAHDYEQIDKAIRRAKREKRRPSLIICNSHIAYGSPNKQDTASAHGEPLGDEEVKAAKRRLGLPEQEAFFVPRAVSLLFSARSRAMKRKAAAWQRRFGRHAEAHPDWAARWRQFFDNQLPADLHNAVPTFDPHENLATRSASGRNLHFGVREHAMAAMLNGMALHGGFRVYGATFFVFLDYCRPAVRLAALMRLPVIHVFTHDSFYVGEDGPTHQPVEHLATLRAIPGILVIRPADAPETAAAWIAALKNKAGPTALVLTRQKLPVIDRSVCAPADRLHKGAYTLWQSAPGGPQALIIASGSEVHLALDAARRLASECTVRVVSMPSWELFDSQPLSYREDVLPPDCTLRLALEAGVALGWDKYLGSTGRMLAMRGFGASAPYGALAREFGYTTQHVVDVIREMRTARALTADRA